MVQVPLNYKDEDKCATVEYKDATRHMVFDMKRESTRSSIFVERGHQNEPPTSANYVSLVSR